jgi:hypothetical protein
MVNFIVFELTVYFLLSNIINKKNLFFIIFIIFGRDEGIMVFNATFNNISAISWRSVLLVEETGVPGENHRPVASY